MLAFAALAGCTATKTWQASEDHGDKPGTGFKLKVANGRVVSGRFYLLDPERPHDFQRGRSVPIRIRASDSNRVQFELNLGPAQKEQLSLRFLKPLEREPVEAELRDESGTGVPTRLKFVPAGSSP
ncbi:MAG: hypothetical protein ABMA26_05105 [Limisphaerales bacterium]